MPFIMNATPFKNQTLDNIWTDSKEKYTLLFFVIVGFSLLLRILSIGANDLLVEEAYYWNYAQHLDFGYLDHPPMIALLIKLSTSLLGTHEFGVRITSLFCWIVTAFFSFKLTELIHQGAGRYAVLLLAILPFFFLHSLVLTPDQPLNVFWAAALYTLYRALVLEEKKQWYLTGLWIGLGMLSKYTIVLLGLATLIYLCADPKSRTWFTKKEPYVCVLIVAVLFTPVIYWNATHEWASFVFQGARRFKASFSFSLPQFFGLLMLFLTPVGVLGLWTLFKRSGEEPTIFTTNNKRFLRIFTIVPLVFFGLFSLNHPIRFNWIGPGLLALIPWLSLSLCTSKNINTQKNWLITAILLLLSYGFMIFAITFGSPETTHKTLLKKYIAWEELTQQLHATAERVEAKTSAAPILVPLDLYNLSSELAFYQAKLFAQGKIQTIYPIIGRHLFGGDSLMYQYWSKVDNLSGKYLLLVTSNLHDFDNPSIAMQTIEKRPVHTIWSHSQGRGQPLEPYYYKVVQVKATTYAKEY